MTFRLPLALLLASSTLVCAACSKKKAPGTATTAASATAASPAPAAAKKAGVQVASCDTIKAEGLCRQYGADNISAAGTDFLKKMCNGKFALTPCPKEKRVGSCATKEGTRIFYKAGPLPYTAATAQKDCKQGVPAGTWKAGE